MRAGVLLMKSRLSQQEAAELFKALGDGTRLGILRLLFQKERCIMEIMERLDMAQSLVSHHVKILKTAGLVYSRREGHKICYALVPEVKRKLSDSTKEGLDLGCCEVTFR